MTPKRMLLLAGALSALGALLRLLGIPWGLDVLVVGVLVAVISVSFAQRALQHEFATARRATAQRLAAVVESQDQIRKILEEHGKLQRTTLYYSKNGAAGPGRGSAESGLVAVDPLRSGIAGRSSTPEVSNESARHSFATLLNSGGITEITGLLSPEAVAALPGQVSFSPLIPFRATETLEAHDNYSLIVIDEAVFATAPWERSVGPVGIGMMNDLVGALSKAQGDGTQIAILRHRRVPDIHDTALDRLRALRLPISETDAAASAGAPATPVITALAHFAEERESR